MPREDRVIEHHRREKSRLSQGHAVMNVRCRRKKRGKRISTRGDTDGQKARLKIGEVERLIRVGTLTRRRLKRKERGVGVGWRGYTDKHWHDFQVIESIQALSGRRNHKKSEIS